MDRSKERFYSQPKVTVPKCSFCKHKRYDKRPVCDAFPGGITPSVIKMVNDPKNEGKPCNGNIGFERE